MESTGFIVLILWTLVAPSLSASTFEWSRLPTFLCIAVVALWNVFFLRSSNVLESITIGLNATLSTIFAANFIILYDIRSVQRLVLQKTEPSHSAVNQGAQNKDHSTTDAKSILTWESIPKASPYRVFWVFDLLTSLRGTHWAWSSIETSSRYAILSKAYSASRHERKLAKTICRFVIDYLVLDFTKCVMLSDPFFNGISTDASPPHLSHFVTSKPALYTYRSLLAALGVLIAVEIEYALVLVIVGILEPFGLGISGSPVTFPPLWGSPLAICRKGLRGFWGETWHQLFRRHFASVGDAVALFVLQKLGTESAERRNDGNTKRAHATNSPARIVLRYTTAFLLSGLVHAAASHTLRGPTRPWRSFLSFALQPLGMAIQSACSFIFVDRYILGSIGRKKTVRQVFNLTFTVIWLWSTMGMILEDLTTGHMWTIEPVPVSLIHGLGFMDDQNWWRW
jgi:hypothetical protein